METNVIRSNLLVIAKCIKNKMKGYSEFSFTGTYLGKTVSKILVESSKSQFIEGEDYLIWARVSSLYGNELRIDAIKSKKV